jgi:ABC-type multidrug transport system permease subunit
MDNQLRAMLASVVQQWKQISFSFGNLGFFLATIPMAIALTWIALQRGDRSVLAYLSIGLPLMTVWSGVAFRIGYTLSTELSNQVLQFVYISRTPVIVVSLGKALAQVLWGLPTGIISFLVVFLMTRTLPSISNPTAFLVSMVLVIIGITIASLFFSPLMVLVGGKGGFFNTVIPFGLVLSGFVFPVDKLPTVLMVPARLIPTSWAMDSINLSLEAGSTWTQILTAWGMSILTSIFLGVVTYAMFRVVERRIRLTGTRDFY